MYFGARHRKGPVDGAVKSRQFLIRSAWEFYNFFNEKLNKHTSGTFVQSFFYIKDIKRDEPIVAEVTKTSSTWHSV